MARGLGSAECGRSDGTANCIDDGSPHWLLAYRPRVVVTSGQDTQDEVKQEEIFHEFHGLPCTGTGQPRWGVPHRVKDKS